jgi:acyl transferase domain-containing protein/predicted O-methyltransferase YrrM/acyl carrier protein
MKDFLERIGKLDAKRLALLAAKLQSRVDALEHAAREPIAIVGLACRFPGGADTPEAFWSVLRDGVDTIREVPRDRWDIDALYDADPDAAGKMSTRWGAFLDHVDRFDAPFFGVAPREAEHMDPQQRLLLELSWEALERAGIAPDELMGSLTGVFVGISGNDYFQLQLQAGLAGLDAYTASGNAHSVAAGRLSFVLGLQGPCFPIETACSSSLVAVHQAVLSLRAGECHTALAGGVNLILSPITTIALSKARMMAPDGRCKAFDARADGFVRGEGGAMLVLKRLSDAQANGDRIVALIRGSAINQDGRSNGLTAPNGPAQEAVIRAALESGGLRPDQIGYVEAHGTGTSLGDPIEVQAIAAALGAGRTEPLAVGSVKANVGHLESAAGIAGLVKLVLALQHREIPPQIHVQSLNPHIPWDALPVTVPTALRAWKSAGPRIGAVSSFGFSGTNAHVVIEEAPPPLERDSTGQRPVHVLTLTARSETALRELAVRYERHLAGDDIDLGDVCFTANTGRARFEHRLAVLADGVPSCRERLRAAVEMRPTPGLFRGRAPLRRPRVAFLYSGQGAQRVNMGRGLFESQPVFRQAVERCDEWLRPHLEHPLLAVLYPSPQREAAAQVLLDSTLYTQPALFTIEYALTELWRSWGVRPGVVVGHSIGEYAAACAAGVFEPDAALRLVYERGRLMQALRAAGAMASVFADEATVAAAIAPLADEIAIAAVNEPAQVVVSGRAHRIDALIDEFTSRGVRCRRLNVAHAFHSPLMDSVLEPFAEAAAAVSYGTAHTTMISCVSGEAAPPGEIGRAEYWTRHIREPVRFAAAARALYESGCRHVIEIGPSAALLAMAQHCVDDNEPDGAWLPSLRSERDDLEQMLDSLARLHVAGIDVDWAALDAAHARRRVLLPTYPFERERYWHVATAPSHVVPTSPAHEVTASVGELDASVRELLYEVVWQPASSPAAVAWVEPAAIGAHLAPRLTELSAAVGMAAYDEMLPRHDAIAAQSIAHALVRLGFDFTPGQRFDATALAERCGIVERHGRLLDRLLCILEEDSVLARRADGWQVLRVPAAHDPVAEWDLLRARFPQFETELTLVTRCATALADVLRGATDPLQLLFPGDALDGAEKLYEDAPVARMFNTVVREAVAEAVRMLPSTTRLRVLEIGAGTGGTTASVLTALPAERTDYVFTDLSPHFVQLARRKFSAFDFVRHDVLDIASDPAAQGYESHAYDIVIAANVLHATPDLRRSLEHTRRLLAPGGLLVLYEAVHRQRFSDLTVGLTAGWWGFTDTGLRPDYALLPRPRWRELLAELGFTGCTILPDESAAGALAHQAVLIARAPEPRDGDGAARAAASWLVFDDAAGTGSAAAALLRAGGERVVIVQPGSAFRRAAEDDYRIDASSGPDYERVLREGAAAWCGVVYLWALDATVDDAAGEADVLRAQEHAVGGALTLVQSLVRSHAAGAARAPRLWLVTRGAQPAGEPDTAMVAAQAPLWGFGHAVALEHPELRCTRLDLDPRVEPQQAAAMLAAELRQRDTAEDRIALRGGERKVPRLARHAASRAAEPVRFTAEGSYLITGGMRGLGLRVAEWMVERGARNLVLLGRAEPSATARAALDRLASAGTRIIVARGDVADRQRLAEILNEIEHSLPPLRGVIHSAGVLDDGVLLQQSWPRFAEVMRPKVAGGWNLHALTARLELDFFIVFSSGVALLGAAGQSNHAAASAFLDGLVHQRRARGLPALAINWGAWSEIGAAVDHRLEERGTATFSPAQGLAALEYALQRAMPAAGEAGRVAQLAVLAADWSSALERWPAGHAPAFLRDVLRTVPSDAAASPASEAARTLLRRLEASPPNRRPTLLLGHVRTAAAHVLGIGDARRVPLQQPLQELGLDSLMAVELRNRLGRDVERTLPATVLYEYPSVAALTTFLARDVLTLDAAQPRSEAAPAATDPAASTPAEDDIATRLLNKLERLDTAHG